MGLGSPPLHCPSFNISSLESRPALGLNPRQLYPLPQGEILVSRQRKGGGEAGSRSTMLGMGKQLWP